MKEVSVSPDFTIEDIHNIREYNYEQTKNMTVNERINYYNNLGKEAEVEITKRKEDRTRP